MRRFFLTLAAASVVSGAGLAGARAQQPQQTSTVGTPNSVNRSGAPADVDRILRTVAQKESEFRKALNEYSFKRDAVVQTIAFGGQISGEYHRVSRFVFDDAGNRFEKILFFPVPTTRITITPEDLEAYGGVQAFAIELSKIHEYDFAYVGKERIDELDLYVFDVTPKVLSDQRRLKEMKKAKTEGGFFHGRIWIDDRDFQIVKARGKNVPEIEQRFPTFETYREQIDGKYWFPTYTYADDELVFKGGDTIRVRMRIKFDEFERLKGTVRVIDEGEPGAVDETKPTPTPTPVKPKP